jgi:hypothetical protein
VAAAVQIRPELLADLKPIQDLVEMVKRHQLLGLRLLTLGAAHLAQTAVGQVGPFREDQAAAALAAITATQTAPPEPMAWAVAVEASAGSTLLTLQAFQRVAAPAS